MSTLASRVGVGATYNACQHRSPREADDFTRLQLLDDVIINGAIDLLNVGLGDIAGAGCLHMDGVSALL